MYTTANEIFGEIVGHAVRLSEKILPNFESTIVDIRASLIQNINHPKPEMDILEFDTREDIIAWIEERLSGLPNYQEWVKGMDLNVLLHNVALSIEDIHNHVEKQIR